MWWANPPALAFWQADSVEALCARDFSGDSPTVRKRLRQVLEGAGRGDRVEETWTLYPAGAPRSVVVAFQPLRIGTPARDGALVEIVRGLEQPPDESSWRIMEATRASSLMLSMFSFEGKLLAQNPASLACYGPRRSGEASDLEARLPELDLWRSILGRVADGEQITWEAQVQTVDGPRTHSISATKGRDPVTGAYVAIFSEEDVTELWLLRGRIEEANRALEATVAERTAELRQSQERYRLAAETAAIWDWDIPKDQLFVSPNFLESLGYEADSVEAAETPLTVQRFIHPEDLELYRRARDRHLAQPGQIVGGEMRFVTKQGEPRWFHVQGKCIATPDGTPVRSVGLISDISNRKELEASLMASQRLEAVGQLTGGIAHDFNNLLTVIQGNAQLLELEERGDPELTREIEAAVTRGADLTRHLLAFSRKQMLVPKPVDIAALLETMRNTLLRVVSEAIAIEVETPSALWPVYADPTQIEAALLNLALNARGAMPNGGTLVISCTNRPIAAQTGIVTEGRPPRTWSRFRCATPGRGCLTRCAPGRLSPSSPPRAWARAAGSACPWCLASRGSPAGTPRSKARRGRAQRCPSSCHGRGQASGHPTRGLWPI